MKATASGRSVADPAAGGPTVTLELAYEPDDGALAEAIAILLDDARAQEGAAA